MQDGQGIKRIPLSRASDLPRLQAPAGYVVVIEDVEYGNRFIIVRLQEVSSRALARAAPVPFETELFLVFSAADAAELALELHDRFAASGDINEWFDLDQAQVAQLREFGQPSLRDLALSEVEGQSLFEKSRIVSAPPDAPLVQAPASRQRPRRSQRRWTAWLLLVAIVTLGLSVLGNAPQLNRLLSGRTIQQEMLAQGKVSSATADPSPTIQAATSGPSPTADAGAGDVFYVLARANARVCASRVCRAAVILDAGARISAQWYEAGQNVDGNSTWIAYRHRGTILYVHSSVLTQDRLEVNAAQRPSATASITAAPSATRTAEPTDAATPTYTLEATNASKPAATGTPADTLAPSATATVEPTSTDEPTATATQTETKLPSATATLASTATATVTATPTGTDVLPTATSTATDRPAATVTAAKYVVDTAQNLNANIRTCPRRSCDIVAKLPAGAPVEVIGSVKGEAVYETDIWFEIKLQDGSAYIHSELAEVSPVSQLNSARAITERFSAPVRKYAHSRVNLRTGPGTQFRLLETVPTGTALEIVGQSGDWYLARYSGREVYIAGWLVHEDPLPRPVEGLGSGSQINTDNTASGQDAVAVNVIDGDTIDVRLDGRTVRVRYIGVDTPERGEPCYAEATNYNRNLVQGKSLTLVRDTSDYGPYGRLLRYVYADGVFVNLALVQAGYAEASYYAPNGKHRNDFEVAERSAPDRGCLGDPAQTNQPQASGAVVDNCCFIGWQCNSEDDWKQGYFAFQENQCERSSQPARSSVPQQEQRKNESYGSCQASYVNNCTHARSLGCSSIPRGHPAYRSALDRDNDGIGCE